MESVVAALPAFWPTRYRSPGIGAVTESAANRRARMRVRRPVRSHRPERLCAEQPDRPVRLPRRCAPGIPRLPARGGKPCRPRAFREEFTVPRTGGLPRHSVPRKLRGRRQSSKRDSACPGPWPLRYAPSPCSMRPSTCSTRRAPTSLARRSSGPRPWRARLGLRSQRLAFAPSPMASSAEATTRTTRVRPGPHRQRRGRTGCHDRELAVPQDVQPEPVWSFTLQVVGVCLSYMCNIAGSAWGGG